MTTCPRLWSFAGVAEDFSFAPLPAPSASGEHTSGSLFSPFTSLAQAS